MATVESVVDASCNDEARDVHESGLCSYAVWRFAHEGAVVDFPFACNHEIGVFYSFLEVDERQDGVGSRL